MAPNQMVLPNGLVTRSDAGRLAKEMENLDNALNQAAIRGENPTELPKMSGLLSEMAAANKLNLLDQSDRQRLLTVLQSIRASAPTLHMSFNSEPSPVFQQRLITWIRQNLHPQLLLQIGLQPNIGAGAMVRSTNKYFDFSLRQRFTEQKGVLISKLKGVETPAVAESPSPEPSVATPPPEQPVLAQENRE